MQKCKYPLMIRPITLRDGGNYWQRPIGYSVPTTKRRRQTSLDISNVLLVLQCGILRDDEGIFYPRISSSALPISCERPSESSSQPWFRNNARYWTRNNRHSARVLPSRSPLTERFRSLP